MSLFKGAKMPGRHCGTPNRKDRALPARDAHKMRRVANRIHGMVSPEIHDCERFCSNCIYEFFGCSTPSCAMDMNHGKRCRFHTMPIEADDGIYNED
jgi:hypothetical protein